MSLALHAHQVLIVATLAFAVSILIPFWYTSPNSQTQRQIFQICSNNTCYWSLIPTSNNPTVQSVIPTVVAAAAVVCGGTSLIALLLGSWYIQRFSGDIGSKWLLVITILFVFFSFLFSGGIWAIMLTTNLHQNDTNIKIIRLEDFGFSFWMNIGATGAYLYAFFIYLIASCKN